jgi:hypothetical protein
VIDRELLETIAPALLDGEQVVWAARPDPHRIFRAVDSFLIPIWLLWTGFAIVVVSVAISNGASPFVAVWVTALVSVGWYVRFRRLAEKWWNRKRTVYVLTDSRVLILTQHRTGLLTYAPRLDLLPSLTCVRRGGGAGDILFGERKEWVDVIGAGMGRRQVIPDDDGLPGFYNLTDVDTPVRILLERNAVVHNRYDL